MEVWCGTRFNQSLTTLYFFRCTVLRILSTRKWLPDNLMGWVTQIDISFSFLLSWVFQVHFNNRLTRDFTLKQGSEKYFIEKIDLVLYQQSFLSHKTTLNKHNIIINMLALVAISGTLAHHILASNCLYCDQLEGDNIKIMTSWQ